MHSVEFVAQWGLHMWVAAFVWGSGVPLYQSMVQAVHLLVAGSFFGYRCLRCGFLVFVHVYILGELLQGMVRELSLFSLVPFTPYFFLLIIVNL